MDLKSILKKAEYLMIDGEDDGAKKIVDAVLRQNPSKDVEGFALYIDAKIARKNWNSKDEVSVRKIISLFEEVEKFIPNDVEVQTKLGQAYYCLHKIDGSKATKKVALTYLEKAIDNGETKFLWTMFDRLKGIKRYKREFNICVKNKDLQKQYLKELSEISLVSICNQSVVEKKADVVVYCSDSKGNSLDSDVDITKDIRAELTQSIDAHFNGELKSGSAELISSKDGIYCPAVIGKDTQMSKESVVYSVFKSLLMNIKSYNENHKNPINTVKMGAFGYSKGLTPKEFAEPLKKVFEDYKNLKI